MKGNVAGNVIWNWSGMAVTMLAGFIVAPYLVHHLGDSGYGLWILIASMTGYFSLLDLGVGASVGRYIAYYRARGDQENVNATLSTAIAILTGVAVLALLVVLALVPMFHWLYAIPPQQQSAATWAIIIVGLNLAMTFPVMVFDGVLWGHERFDLINVIDIPTAIIRTGLTFLLVHGPDDIVKLAILTFIMTALNEGAKLIAAFRADPDLRVSIRLVRREAAGRLYGYGVWQFLLNVSRQINAQIGPLVIGALLSVAVVTPFSIAARLVSYASQFMVAATGVFTPIATGLCARDDLTRQRRMFLLGGQCCAAFATFTLLGLLLLGGPLLRLWMGSRLAEGTTLLLAILALGEWLAMSQWLTGSMILAMARHRLSALANLCEGAVAVTGMLLVVKAHGLVGVCIVFACAAFLCRGVFQMVYGCRLLKVSVWRYVGTALFKPLAVAVLPGTILATAVWARPPASWIELLLYGAGFSAVFAVAVLWLLGWWTCLPFQALAGYRNRGIAKATVEA